jgi:NAD+ diphosphatase
MAFFGATHDRAVESRRDEASLQRMWAEPGTRALVVAGGEVQVDPETDAPLWWPTDQAPTGERYLLGVDAADRVRFAVQVSVGAVVAHSKGLRELAPTVSAAEAGWLCHAVALAQWHVTHTHCPRCGGPTQVSAAGAERHCPSDGSSHFPRVDPAVIVLVTDAEDRALLGRQHAWPAGRFSTLAGFVEPGETAEQAVRRVVAEEAGILVDQVQLLATQPWPFPSSLMIAASAVVVGSPEPRPDGVELVDVRWFSRDELAASVVAGEVAVPGSISISRWLINSWYGAPVPDDDAGWR